MAPHSGRPAQLVLLATVVRRHFLAGRSKVEIAEEFGFSRFTVARLIDAAHERGIVHIEIRHADGIDVDLSGRGSKRSSSSSTPSSSTHPATTRPTCTWDGPLLSCSRR